MLYLVYIAFGFAPSIIWLLFFLRKDSHPEPKRMVLKIFFYGMLITIPVALIEIGILAELSKLGFYLPPILISILFWFLGIAFIEEFVKYLLVKKTILNDPEFDEPVDAMLYMIIVALGFAALENIFYLLPDSEETLPLLSKIFLRTFIISSVRFLGATFLHALTSGILGYFLAQSIFRPKRTTKLLATGLISATLLHGLFNLSIINIGKSLILQNGKLAISNFQNFVFFFVLLVTILIGLAIFVSLSFKKLKKMASVCKVK